MVSPYQVSVTKRIVVATNSDWCAYNFRPTLIRTLLSAGYPVTVVAPSDGYHDRLLALGCDVERVSIDKTGANPLRDLRLCLQYRNLYRRLQPVAALHYAVKPVICGTLACVWLGIPSVNMITGLGTAFIRDSWLTRVVELLYRITLRRSTKLFFQNHDDLNLLVERRVIRSGLAERLPGSGVDLDRFAFRPLPPASTDTFLLVARMLWDKGVGEFVEAARSLRQAGVAGRFQLLGVIGAENRTAIPAATIQQWVAEGVVEYLGATDDVRPFLANATCVVLPSYREGIPRTLLEAAAMGRPVIAADSAGCRDVVEDGVSGFLCQVRSASDLADKLTRFTTLSPDGKAAMGQAGRRKMEQEFDERIVIRRYIEVIKELDTPH